MAAPTYTTDLRDISLAETITNWGRAVTTGTSPFQGGGQATEAVGADFVIQGTNSISYAANARHYGIVYSLVGAGTTESTATLDSEGCLYFWSFVGPGSGVEPYRGTVDSSDILANSTYAGDGGGHVWMAGTGAETNALYASITGGDLYGTSGRNYICHPLQIRNISAVPGVFDTTAPWTTQSSTANDKNNRLAENVKTALVGPTLEPPRFLGSSPLGTLGYVGYSTNFQATARGPNAAGDAIRYGTGHFIAGGDTTNGLANFVGLNEFNDSVDGRYGIFLSAFGAYELKGKLYFGVQTDKSTADSCNFFSDGAIINIPDDRQITLRDLSAMRFYGTTNSVFNINNMTLSALGNYNSGGIEVVNKDAKLTLTDSLIKKIADIELGRNTVISGTTFVRCGRVIQDSATISNCVFDTPEGYWKNEGSLFVNDLSKITNTTFKNNLTSWTVPVASDNTTFSANTNPKLNYRPNFPYKIVDTSATEGNLKFLIDSRLVLNNNPNDYYKVIEGYILKNNAADANSGGTINTRAQNFTAHGDNVSNATSYTFTNNNYSAIYMDSTSVANGTTSINVTGLTFEGYSDSAGSNLLSNNGDSDAAFFNNTGRALTLNLIDTPLFSVQNGIIGSSTTLVQSTTVTVLGLLGNTEIKVLPTSGSPYSGNALNDTLSITTETVSADTNVGDGGSNYIGYTNSGGFVQINANGTNTFTNFPGVLQDTNSTNPRALAAGDTVRVVIRDNIDNSSLQLFDEFVVSGTPSASTILTTTSFSGFTSAFGTTLNSANSKTVTVEKVNARYQFSVPTGTEIDFLTYRVGSNPILTTGQTINSENRTFPVSQTGDRNYRNPA